MKPRANCVGCHAPIPFQPGAGGRLCPFCGWVNLVREQEVAVPALELKIDEIFQLLQAGELGQALEETEALIRTDGQNVRLSFYHACGLFASNRYTDAIYALVDLTGSEAALPLRADIHTKLAEALLMVGRVPEARQSVTKALALMENHPTARVVLARILLQQGDNREAIDLLEGTLPSLPQRWKISFPVRTSTVLLLLSRAYLKERRIQPAVDTLEHLLVQETAAPIDQVAEAIQLWGKIEVEERGDPGRGLKLLRQGLLLDPENLLGLQEDLGAAVAALDGDPGEAVSRLEQERREAFAEIREAFRATLGFDVRALERLVPQYELDQLNADPHRRVDFLELILNRFAIRRFDRGTLYPLKTLEEFRCWLVATRLREALRQNKLSAQENERLTKLMRVREATQKDVAPSPPALPSHLKRRWLARLPWLVLLGAFFFAVAFFAVVGDRWLDRFQGTLNRVECPPQDDHSCMLFVLAGDEGRERYQTRTEDPSWFRRTLSGWLDQRVRRDGTIIYPLDFPWGSIPGAAYQKCIGGPIAKRRFSLAPQCRPREPSP